MKLSKKLHLLDVDDPLVCFEGLIARCGYVFHFAKIGYAFSDSFKPSDLWLEGFSELELCRACRETPPNTADEKREYLYGLIEKPDRHTLPADYPEVEPE